MKVMKHISLIIFLVSTAVHLFASHKQDKRLRDITKPFILLSLMGYYCFSVEKARPVVILALLFSWIGDILLIPKGLKWFTAGGISFMISHFFFVLSYVKDIGFSLIHPLIILCLGAFFFFLVMYIFRWLKPWLPKQLYYPMYLYLLINGTMNCFAIFRYLCNKDFASLITMIGAILFFISDTVLFHVRFKKDSRVKTHFTVMLTYSIGEFLIVLGLILK